MPLGITLEPFFSLKLDPHGSASDHLHYGSDIIICSIVTKLFLVVVFTALFCVVCETSVMDTLGFSSWRLNVGDKTEKLSADP